MLEQEWLNFKCEFDLADFEVTHFTIKKKKRYYVRLGSWSALSHIRRTPAEIWSSSSSGKLRVPRVSTSSISMTLAQAIGSLDLTLPTHYSRVPADSKSISDSESNDKQCSDNEEESSKNEKEASMYDTHLLIDLPDADKFPLLNSLFLTNAGHCNLFDRLVNEITKFSGGTEINYKRGNNSEGTLIAIPAFRTLRNYEKSFCSIIDTLIKAVSRNTKCKPNEACEAFLGGFYNSYEDSFISTAVKQGVANGIPPKVMDEVSVEAMLNEAGVNWTNARVLFRHLKQYFGRSLVVSEKK